MQKIAVLIPTYKRSDRLRNIFDNFNRTTTEGSLYFIITPEDKDSINEIKKIGADYFVVPGEYCKAINAGFSLTNEPFVFCGADDIEFTNGWDKKLLQSIDGVGVTGGIDDWLPSKSGVHTSHPLVRRSYILDQGGCLGYPGLVYNPNREHYHLDIELEQLAWSRGQIRINSDCIIHHNHFVNGKAKNDETYQHSRACWDKDDSHYQQTKHLYEFWDLPALHQGRAEPSIHRIKRLSVVMPIWNCKDYTLKTLDSLMQTTKHPYELILIDDHSTEFDGHELLKEMKSIASKRFLLVKTVVNDRQLYCNANWNKGVELATGDYIAIINSDIEFLTDEWDDFLTENIDLGYDLVNPFQQDRVYPESYMKPPHEDALYKLNIRGAGYMISKEFAKKCFPIPKELKHWCGDNWISLKARTYLYDIRVVIYHYISKSGEKVDQRLFWQMVYQDVLNYQKLTGDLIPSVQESCEKRLKYFN